MNHDEMFNTLIIFFVLLNYILDGLFNMYFFFKKRSKKKRNNEFNY